MLEILCSDIFEVVSHEPENFLETLHMVEDKNSLFNCTWNKINETPNDLLQGKSWQKFKEKMAVGHYHMTEWLKCWNFIDVD